MLSLFVVCFLGPCDGLKASHGANITVKQIRIVEKLLKSKNSNTNTVTSYCFELLSERMIQCHMTITTVMIYERLL